MEGQNGLNFRDLSEPMFYVKWLPTILIVLVIIAAICKHFGCMGQAGANTEVHVDVSNNTSQALPKTARVHLGGEGSSISSTNMLRALSTRYMSKYIKKFPRPVNADPSRLYPDLQIEKHRFDTMCFNCSLRLTEAQECCGKSAINETSGFIICEMCSYRMASIQRCCKGAKE